MTKDRNSGPELVLYTDGGSEPNPGPSAIGYVIFDSEGRWLAAHGEAIGHATNNVAEYRALIAGLERCAEVSTRVVRAHSDSKQVVEQVNQRWRTNDPALRRLRDEARRATKQFQRFILEHRRRTNPRIAEADALVNRALGRHPDTMKSPRPEGHLSGADLRRAGWTEAMVKNFLGDPDTTRANPYRRHGPPMRLYDNERVGRVQESPEWQKAWARLEKLRSEDPRQ